MSAELPLRALRELVFAVRHRSSRLPDQSRRRPAATRAARHCPALPAR
ncbi:hypothetical protein [Streptomyces sp. NPDC059828]